MKARIIVFLLCSFYIISCKIPKYEITQVYHVGGDRTGEIRINFTDTDGTSTVKIDAADLPWTKNVTLEGSKNRNKEWFLSAESVDVNGGLFVQIGAERFTVLNATGRISSNYTDTELMVSTTLVE